jgi:hypothetical protein
MPPIFQFRYSLIRTLTPWITLGGRWVRPRPIIEIEVAGPLDSRIVDGLIDSGADETILPSSIASDIGIDLSHSPMGTNRGITGDQLSLSYAEVTLALFDGTSIWQWPAMVGFHTLASKRAILGFAGFLQFMTTTMEGDFEVGRIQPNSLFPGTITP